MSSVRLRLGVLGLGSVFWTPYRGMIKKLADEGRVDLVAGFDPDPAKCEALAPFQEIQQPFSVPLG